MYSVTGLASGSHTLAIEVTGTKSSSSGGMWVTVDAFDVTTDSTSTTSTTPTNPTPPTTTSAPMRAEQNSSSFTYTGSSPPHTSTINSSGPAPSTPTST